MLFDHFNTYFHVTILIRVIQDFIGIRKVENISVENIARSKETTFALVVR